MVEYALIVALISIVAIAVLVLVGKKIGDIFSNVDEELSNALTTEAP